MPLVKGDQWGICARSPSAAGRHTLITEPPLRVQKKCRGRPGSAKGRVDIGGGNETEDTARRGLEANDGVAGNLFASQLGQQNMTATSFAVQMSADTCDEPVHGVEGRSSIVALDLDEGLAHALSDEINFGCRSWIYVSDAHGWC